MKSEDSSPLSRADRARLVALGIEVMGSGEHALKWLEAPQRGLGGVVPLEHARTKEGLEEVAQLLGRIEEGVYT